ncbi:response regulator transcription factor [Paenibacillus taiwanensis]|uniref:response regulator transcription factor n=1 Tax=Paenibacillus taiwanensis TaxID=401638 RepID=UPI0004908431|nr:response regulator transcription factor [Paenibacillus taiwanensis]
MDWREANVLVVEDEAALLNLVVTVLRKEGFLHIHTSSNAEQALELCQQHSLDCIILDVTLPGRSGFDVAPHIRAHTDAPIVFVTARTTDLDKLTGFALGGDDYVTKPFNPLELAARVKAHLKRHLALKQRMITAMSTQQQPHLGEMSHPAYKSKPFNEYDYGHFLIREEAGELIVNHRAVDCPAMVFQLLLFLCKHPNRIFSKGELYEKVWGLDALKDDNTVMVHIHRIRERIEPNPSEPQYLLTVRGMGYKLIGAKSGSGSTLGTT